MADPLTYLQHRANDDWLIGYNSQEFLELVNQAVQALNVQQQTSVSSPLIVLLAERHPLKFLARFLAACSINCHLFLCNPDWAESEWQQVFNLIQPDLMWGEVSGVRGQFKIQNSKFKIQNTLREGQSPTKFKTFPLPPSLIMIPTGGSSGKLRFAIHTWDTLMASVAGFQQYFGVNQVNSFCVLPLYHVSGLMQCLRSLTSGGKLVIFPFKSLAAVNLPDLNPADFFLSLVPTQLQRLLCPLPSTLYPLLSTPHSPLPTPWLTQFKTVLLGGAPAWIELLEQARRHGIRLAPTYGMTETASQVATLKPDDFLNGQMGCGQVLPHAQVMICNEAGENLGINHLGVITIRAASLALGYYREPEVQHVLQTDDLGHLDAQGYLHVVGRRSDKIITGGENVFPAEVEAAIRETGLVEDVCVVGVSDRTWGQAITAVYVPRRSETIAIETVKASLANRLSKFKQPKRWIAVDELPRNAQGKINRQGLMAMRELLPTDSASC